MQYVSTRHEDLTASVDEAILRGLAADGGLYVPAAIPTIRDWRAFSGLGLEDLAIRIIEPFFEGSRAAGALSGIVARAYSFPAPLAPALYRGAPFHLLELFHGPTAAFKDFGARFLIECLGALAVDEPPRILVATSGDTGGAVAAAAAGAGLSARILFPKGGVSSLQERQLCCWPDNIKSLRIDADFDACQALVKRAFADAALRRARALSSANSINIARLLAQLVYYWSASVERVCDTGRPANFIVPTGNLGNALACVWARAMGAPIERVHLAVNANTTLADFARTGNYEERRSVRTLSNAMDVGAPSNVERLRAALDGKSFDAAGLSVSSHVDNEIRGVLREFHSDAGRFICPHTAVGVAALGPASHIAEDWVVAATAHPAKFNDVIEPVVGASAPEPPSLAGLYEARLAVTDLPNDYDAVRRAILRD